MVERNRQQTTNDFLKFVNTEIKKKTFIDLKKVEMYLLLTSKKIISFDAFAYGENKERDPKYFMKMIRK